MNVVMVSVFLNSLLRTVEMHRVSIANISIKNNYFTKMTRFFIF